MLKKLSVSFLLKGMIALPLFTPLVFGFVRFEYPKSLFFKISVEILFFLYLIFLLKKQVRPPAFSILILSVGVFAGMLFLSSIFGLNFLTGFWGNVERGEGVILHIHLLAFLLTITAVLKNSKDWLSFTNLVAGVGTAVAATGIMQKFGVPVPGTSLPMRVSGTLGNPDFFAAYLVPIIFLVLLTLIREQRRAWKIIWLAALVIVAAAIVLSGTRAAWIGAGAGAAFLGVYGMIVLRSFSSRFFIISLISTLAILLLCLGALWFQAQLGLDRSYLYERFLGIFYPDSSLWSRISAWSVGLRAFLEKPLLGWGPESFLFLTLKYFSAQNLEYFAFFDRAHNKLIELLAETGILGTAAYLIIWILIFILIIRRIREENLNKNRKAGLEGAVLLALLLAMFTQNLFTFDSVSTYIIFFFLVGFVSVNYSHADVGGYGARLLAIITPVRKFLEKLYCRNALVLVLVSAVLAVFAVNIRLIWWEVKMREIKTLEKQSFEKALLGYQEMLNFSTVLERDLNLRITGGFLNMVPPPGREDSALEFALLIKKILGAYLESPDRSFYFSSIMLIRVNERLYIITKNPAFLAENESIARTVLRLNPHQPDFYELIGVSRIMRGDFQKGESYFQMASAIRPPILRMRVDGTEKRAVAYLRAGDKEKALHYFIKGLLKRYYEAKFSGFPVYLSESVRPQILGQARFWEGAGILAAELGRWDLADQVYGQLIEMYPQHQSWLQYHLDALKSRQRQGPL